jgi:hypothetical protein
VAQRIGKWNTIKEIDPPKVKIELRNRKKSILKSFKRRDEFYEEVKNILSKKNYLFMSYERDVKEDPNKAFKKIINYLDLKVVNVKISSKKINKRTLGEAISNFEEVKNVLEKTEYEWMVRNT